MGVSEELGVSCRETPDWTRRAWPGWVELHPGLAAAGDPAGLRSWLRSAGPAEVDEVLFDLAVLAAADGGDDVVAARTLAWTLAPAASNLAARLSTSRGDADHAVASELWLAVRTFPWRRLRKVAANILGRVRTAVLVELGVGREARRLDPTWAASDRLEDLAAPEELMLDGDDPPSWRVLDSLLATALHDGVITPPELNLLLDLAAEIDRHPESHPRARGGFMSTSVCAAVGDRLGCSVRTIRRRAKHALDALAQVAGGLLDAA